MVVDAAGNAGFKGCILEVHSILEAQHTDFLFGPWYLKLLPANDWAAFVLLQIEWWVWPVDSGSVVIQVECVEILWCPQRQRPRCYDVVVIPEWFCCSRLPFG